jgi:hypothetical protein
VCTNTALDGPTDYCDTDNPLTFGVCQSDASCLVTDICDDGKSCTTDTYDPSGPSCSHTTTGLCFCSIQTVQAENGARVLQEGNWGVPVGTVLSGGAGLEASGFVSGEKLHFWFYGRGLVVGYAVGPNGGKFGATLAGSSTVVDQNAGGFAYQQETVIKEGLSPGLYKLTITDLAASGEYTRIDYFRVLCNK